MNKHAFVAKMRQNYDLIDFFDTVMYMAESEISL
jgi:hypothetical protein